MSPEAIILSTNAILVGFAYLLAYPLLRVRTLPRLMLYDTAVTAAALTVGGFLYAGSGVGFSLIVVDVNWFVFTLVTFGLIELWPMRAYMARHGIRLEH